MNLEFEQQASYLFYGKFIKLYIQHIFGWFLKNKRNILNFNFV